MDITKLSTTDKLNNKENQFLITEEIKENITTQFNFENIGYNYLNDYEHIPYEIYDWLLQSISELYVEVDELILVYSDKNRIKLTATSLYEFLFVTILDHIDKIDFDKPSKQLRTILNDKLNTLKSVNNDSDNGEINEYILKQAIVLDALNNDLSLFDQNYWPMFIEKFGTLK